ncbi:unnamed protein product [Pleuronectes platessa]|uniref:Uncharacterized protein n=1 Tax=Pleuronectes platessa TaxID=8262 RepID=A0A9N7VLB7_PLEPL|nr:unnamed protein product [Pleuronectes platessa]
MPASAARPTEAKVDLAPSQHPLPNAHRSTCSTNHIWGETGLVYSPYGGESVQRETQADLTLGNRPHPNSSICGQLSVCVGMCMCLCCTLVPVFNPPVSYQSWPPYHSQDA